MGLVCGGLWQWWWYSSPDWWRRWSLSRPHLAPPASGLATPVIGYCCCSVSRDSHHVSEKARDWAREIEVWREFPRLARDLTHVTLSGPKGSPWLDSWFSGCNKAKGWIFVLGKG